MMHFRQVQQLNNSTTQQLNNSTIQRFNNSTDFILLILIVFVYLLVRIVKTIK